ncbi:F-box protein At-B isoform X2 [Phoenix dactylifera]|uniref:F-box protein At-B isoform X2 n=1 Tax=Phoenix dactylifera TaxID=42345 RepID=A0A8B8ZF86_PHODC|nr:F-box protein At-B isoform X2 [Phoenix dactylifera]XP_038972792.1 F-box protein At-B isoform X2 [Phoenix dactylifera]
MAKVVRGGGDGGLIERLPQSLVLEIFGRLDLESLCSAAPACKALRFSVSQVLSTISTIDLSGFSHTVQILNRVLTNNRMLRSLTLDCVELDDSSIEVFGKEHLQELVLLKCFRFSLYILTAISRKCPNLRLLSLEMVCPCDVESPDDCNNSIAKMLEGCLYLESLSIKFHDHYGDTCYVEFSQLILPKTIRVLLLQPISDRQAKLLVLKAGADRNSTASLAGAGSSFLRPNSNGLQSLSLVLNKIKDELLIAIASSLPQLVGLCLEDKPLGEPSLHNDLTNRGLQSLGSCRNLTSLSLTRSRQNYPATFRRVNDVGILLLSEGCRRLESVRLGGFSRVTDAGYVSFLHSCKNLKRFEVVNAFFLSDLAFHNLADATNSLVEVRLLSCNLVTSETAESLSLCRNLEVLDLSGCKSTADVGLISISKLCKLTTLDLGGADITDSGLAALGHGSCPIASLCLRGCKRITDRGIALLLYQDGIIRRTLSTLDLGYLPGLSDKGMSTIAEVCREITNLSIRSCFYVTDASITVLGSMEAFEGKRRPLRKLDLYSCSGLSNASFWLLAPPFFRGLRWLGVGNTRLLDESENRFVELSRDRPCLTICTKGCEMGCKAGFHALT